MLPKGHYSIVCFNVGLKKFRRQLTIEEQAKIEEVPEVVVDEELDDIDRLRDDLQATKQLLEIELRNKRVEKELNEKLQNKLKQMEEEMKSLKTTVKATERENQKLTEKLIMAEKAEKSRTETDGMDSLSVKTLLPLEPSFSFADLKRDLSMAQLSRNDSVIFTEIDAFEEEYNSLQVGCTFVELKIGEQTNSNIVYLCIVASVSCTERSRYMEIKIRFHQRRTQSIQR
jgi:hypothetical protein